MAQHPNKKDAETVLAQQYIENNGYIYLDLMEELARNILSSSEEEIKRIIEKGEKRTMDLAREVAVDIGRGVIHDEDGYITRELSKIGIAVVRENGMSKIEHQFTEGLPRSPPVVIAAPEERKKPEDISITNELLLLNRASKYLGDYPVDETINLSLIPKEDIETNMKTWAYIIALNNSYGLDVNYIFKSDDEKYKTETKRILFDKIDEISSLKHLDAVKLKAQVADTYRPGALKVHIMKKEDLEKLKDIPEDVLPVAMSEGNTLEEIPLRDFMSASAIGLAQAACKRMKKENNPHLLEVIEHEILPRMQYIYQRIFPDKDIKEIVTKETLLNMIDDNPIVRKNLAIALALPPIIRVAIQYLKDYHDRIHLLLQAA